MTTALAIRPKDQAIEFRRCTGHCCDPVSLAYSPGELRHDVCRGVLGDAKWIHDNLIYLGWRPPSRGGWHGHGTFMYRCPHFDRSARKCRIYGQGLRSRMCREHPHYGRGLWETCVHEGCTRRTMVLNMDNVPVRWRFPDLWLHDEKRLDRHGLIACHAEYGPETMPEGSEE